MCVCGIDLVSVSLIFRLNCCGAVQILSHVCVSFMIQYFVKLNFSCHFKMNYKNEPVHSLVHKARQYRQYNIMVII